MRSFMRTLTIVVCALAVFIQLTACGAPADQGETETVQTETLPPADEAPVKNSGLVCVYYDGLWDKPLDMAEDDLKATDIVYYLSIYVQGDTTLQMSNDALTPEHILQAKSVNPSLRVLATLVGDNRGDKVGAREFANAVSTPEKRSELCSKIRKSLDYYGFDGVDINWEYPQNEADMANEVNFIRELRLAVNAGGLHRLITAAVPATYYGFETHDLCGMLPDVDFFNVMTYDFHINDTETLHHTAPYNDATGKYADRGYSCAKTLEIFNENGIPSEKIILGCGLYTLEWKDVEEGCDHGFNSTGTRVFDRTYHYKDLKLLTEAGGFTRYWDAAAKAAWWYNADARVFLTSDDDESVRAKAELANLSNCAGVMLFSYFTFRGNTLLTSVRHWADGDYTFPAAVEW